jgi:homoserine O-succinyltransferase
MAIRLPEGLPARAVLECEGIADGAPAGAGQGAGQGAGAPQGPPLRIALVNLMPQKIATETQLARLLGGTDHDVELTLVLPDGYAPRHAPAEHVARFYKRFSEIRDRRFDGLIVTGAPVETLAFEEVRYWRELTRIFDWARHSVRGSYYICWAAQAALYHFHGVQKHPLPEKRFGVYPQRVVRPEAPLLLGLGNSFPVPVSRHTEVRAAELPPGAGLEVLAQSPETGLCLIEDRPRHCFYMFNHLEYDAGTLAAEYRRDLEAGEAIDPPRHTFPHDDPAAVPANTWRPAARTVFGNWLAALRRPWEAKADAEHEAGQAISWLLSEPRRLAVVGAGLCDLLVACERGPGGLVTVLRALQQRGASPRAVKVHRQAAGAWIEVRAGGLGGARSERAAHELAALPGIRSVVYRESASRGGLFLSAGPERRDAPPAVAAPPPALTA